MSLSQSDIDALVAADGPADADAASPVAPPDRGLLPQDIRRILGLPVPMTVTLTSQDLSIGTILDLHVGTILEFEEQFDADLILNVADHPIGAGQAVKVGENFGLRITEIGSVKDRIGAMGGH